MLKPFFEGARESVIVVPKGGAKTTTTAAVGVHELVTVPEAEIIVVAASRDQATILLDAVRGFVRRNPALQRHLKVTQRTVSYPRLGGRLRVLSADVATSDGTVPTLGLVDELHRHKSPELYTLLRDGLFKRGGKMATISTAGIKGESPFGSCGSARWRCPQHAGMAATSRPQATTASRERVEPARGRRSGRHRARQAGKPRELAHGQDPDRTPRLTQHRAERVEEIRLRHVGRARRGRGGDRREGLERSHRPGAPADCAPVLQRRLHHGSQLERRRRGRIHGRNWGDRAGGHRRAWQRYRVGDRASCGALGGPRERGVVCDEGGPAGSLAGRLEEYGLEVISPSTREVSMACTGFVDAVNGATLRHHGSAPLNASVTGAVKRSLAQSWAFDRRKAISDSSPLMAATLALWGLRARGPISQAALDQQFGRGIPA